jgi:hypothetical protein
MDREEWNEDVDAHQRKWAQWQMLANEKGRHDWLTYFLFWHPKETVLVLAGLAAFVLIIWIIARLLGPPIAPY